MLTELWLILPLTGFIFISACVVAGCLKCKRDRQVRDAESESNQSATIDDDSPPSYDSLQPPPAYGAK